MSPRRLPLVLAVLATLAGLVLTACGGGASSGGGESADAVLRDTFTKGRDVDSGRIAMRLDTDVRGVRGLEGRSALRVAGPFQSRGDGRMPSFDLALEVTRAGQDVRSGATSTGDRGYLRIDGQAYEMPDAVFRQFSDAYLRAQRRTGTGGAGLGAIGLDPRAWLRAPRRAGEEQVAGVTTIHVTAGVDVGRVVDDLNRLVGQAGAVGGAAGAATPQLSDAQRREVARAVREANVDVFTGKDDRRLRRLDLEVRLGRSGSIGGGTFRLTLELSALDEEQRITPPRGARSLQDLVERLSASSSSSSSSTASSTVTQTQTQTQTQTRTGGANTAYGRCVEAAGADLEEVQACAELL